MPKYLVKIVGHPTHWLISTAVVAHLAASSDMGDRQMPRSTRAKRDAEKEGSMEMP